MSNDNVVDKLTTCTDFADTFDQARTALGTNDDEFLIIHVFSKKKQKQIVYQRIVSNNSNLSNLCDLVAELPGNGEELVDVSSEEVAADAAAADVVDDAVDAAADAAADAVDAAADAAVDAVADATGEALSDLLGTGGQ